MGLFSSKTVNVYTPYSMLLYQEMPPLVKQTVAGSVVQNRNIGKDLIANLVNGILWKANGLYNWAKTNHPWGLPDGYLAYDTPADVTLIEACARDDLGKAIKVIYTRRIPISGGRYRYEVIYELVGRKDSKQYTWTYDTGTTNKYPVLEVTLIKQDSPYYPIIPIRVANENIAESGKPHRTKVKQALNYLNLNVDDIYKSIKESTEESGESPADDMYVILAVSVASPKPAAKEYIYRYFKYLSIHSLNTKSDHDYWKQHGEAQGFVLPTNKVVIKDSRFNQEIEYDYITTKIVKGSIGKKNTTKVSYMRNSGTVQVNTGSGMSSGYSRTTSGIKIQSQISNTEYEEIYVHGLMCRTLVVGSSWEDVDLGSAFENPDAPTDGQCFLLPLHKDVCESLGPIKAHDLMYESIRLYSNDHHSYKKKWYQSGLFKVFVVIVAVVVSIWNAPAGVALFSAAMAGIVIQTVIISMVIMPAVTTLLQDVFGERLGLLIAILAIAMAGSGNFSVSVENGVSMTTTVTTQTAFAGINGLMSLTSAINSFNTEDKMIDYGNEIKGLQEELDAMYEEAAQAGYNVSMVASAIKSDPYALLEPNTYVQRALMEPRIPTLIGESTLRYVDIKRHLDTSQTALNLGHS